jgi:serine phosphatase RsbU (regulator of sigma subunit)
VCAQELSQKCDDEFSYGREKRIADIIHLCYCGEGPSVERLEATATVLGLFPDWVCSLAEVQLAPGDVLGIYPDGITEATNEHKEEFGEARLLEILRSSRRLLASEIVRSAERLVKQFSRREQTDDLTLLVTKAL